MPQTEDDARCGEGQKLVGQASCLSLNDRQDACPTNQCAVTGSFRHPLRISSTELLDFPFHNINFLGDGYLLGADAECIHSG